MLRLIVSKNGVGIEIPGSPLCPSAPSRPSLPCGPETPLSPRWPAGPYNVLFNNMN